MFAGISWRVLRAAWRLVSEDEGLRVAAADDGRRVACIDRRNTQQNTVQRNRVDRRPAY